MQELSNLGKFERSESADHEPIPEMLKDVDSK